MHLFKPKNDNTRVANTTRNETGVSDFHALKATALQGTL